MVKNNPPLEGNLKLKKLKIIKNPLAVSVDKAILHTSAKKTPQIFNYQTINSNVRDMSLNSKNLTPTYRVMQSKSELPSMNNKSGRLTFDGVFNKQDVKKINMNPFNIPPIIIGSFQNQPQISININNYNINNYSSNKLKNSINMSNNNIYKKKNEPVKILHKPIEVNERPETRMNKIKLVKQDLFIEDDSMSIPHSNSNIIMRNKKVLSH
jgi:hypothetical protein